MPSQTYDYRRDPRFTKDNPAVTPAMKAIADKLTPKERVELAQAMYYLGSFGAGGGRPLPEVWIGKVLQAFSPRVREAVMEISRAMSNERDMPFQPKVSEADRAVELNLDPDRAQAIKGAMDAEEVQAGLLARMPVEPNLAPPTLREQVEAAMALNQSKGV